MKKILLIVFTFALASCGHSDKVIDYPAINSGDNSSYIQFYQSIVTDTALVLTGNLYNRPNKWVSIAETSILKGTQTGKEYKLLKAEGITLGEREFMPESGTIPFTLYFQPTDKADKTADFIEITPENDGTEISGIFLKKPKIKQKIHCLIQGSVIDNPAYSRLVLVASDDDQRVNNWVSIPVNDGKFSYELSADRNDAYEIYVWLDYMNGSWEPIHFFAENGTINITIDTSGSEINTECPETKEFLNIKKELEVRFQTPMREEALKLEEENKVYLPEITKLMERLDSSPNSKERQMLRETIQQKMDDRTAYTDECRDFLEKSDKVQAEYENHIKDYIINNNTLSGLLLLYQTYRRETQTGIVSKYAQSLVEIYKKSYAGKFSDNAIAKKMELKINAAEIKPGNKYPDFTAPDIDGKTHRLSEEINGQVALIDLWASWCGPCRRNSKSMIPIYEKYKDKGFTVVGVARETKAENMTAAIENDGYKWLNLLEINDRNKIWRLYGADNAGGKSVLVDRDGTILAVDPSAEDVEKILSEKL